VLVRERSSRTNLSALDEVALGDLCDRSTLVPALRDVRYLIHAAADYRLWAPVPGEIMRTNLEGTQHIMEQALRAGVKRIVHTSSVATIALKDGSAVDESSRLSETEAIGAYKKSKVAAERLVESMVAQQGLPAVIVNPSTPIGPRDVKPTPTGRIIIQAGSGRMPGLGHTGLNLPHVHDIPAGAPSGLPPTPD